MPVPQPSSASKEVLGPLGGLLLSLVRTESTMQEVRALRWYRDLSRLGVHVPLFLVHDFGLLLSAPREQLHIGPRPGLSDVLARADQVARAHSTYAQTLEEAAQSEVSQRARTLRLSDDLVIVALARILGPLARHIPNPGYQATIPLDPELLRDIDSELATLFFAMPRNFEASALEALANARLHVLTLVDALDLDTLRLLGMLGPESSAAGALEHVDLLSALSTPEANDVVNFSLELLPSILETTRNRSAGTQAMDGYSGLGNRGSVDSLVLSELAWDPDELARRMLEGEILYYSRDQASEVTKRLHYLLIDASASMRGERQVFARGLAIALAKKLDLAGEEVWMRFFDSRLYDIQRRGPGQVPAGYLLSFKGERGRHPARVFAQLATELALLRARDARDPVLHIITHAALHIPRGLVQDIRAHANVFGVFILPSGGTLDLDYLDLLSGHAVVDHATLQARNARAAAAAKIVGEVSRAREVEPVSVARPTPRVTEEGIPPSLRGGGPRSSR